MGRKSRRIKAVLPEKWRGRKLCPYCNGSDGNKKEVYDSPEDAMSVAEHIKTERGVALKVYRCPYKTGWHLTKDNETDGAESRTRKIRDSDIPLSSRYNDSVRWEYVEEDASPPRAYTGEVTPTSRRKPAHTSHEKNMERIVPRERDKNISLEGRVVEIVKNVSIEGIFKINPDNLFSAVIAKDFMDGEYQQITVHAGRGGGRTGSYTALVKKTLMQKYRIKKDDTVRLVVSGRRVNNKTVWRCESITPYS